MNANPGIGSPHPHAAPIPDPRVEGVRFYREPAVPHPLQISFLEEAGERAWVEEMRGLLGGGRAEEADARLAAALAGFDGALARLCRTIAAADVDLEGWDDLLPVLAEWEGPPVTAITLGLTNPPDLVFDPGSAHSPELLLALYSDEAFPFSSAAAADILAECQEDAPAWVGAEEDVEFYCAASGLAELNSALIHCKHRHFLRDGRDGVEGRAPGGYVEYVLGCWLLATRFLQAAERAAANNGMPAGCRFIVGAVDIGADFITVLGPEPKAGSAAKSRTAPPEPAFATLSMKPWVPREDPTIATPASGPTLRQRLQPVEAAPVEPERQSFVRRLLGRFRRS